MPEKKLNKYRVTYMWYARKTKSVVVYATSPLGAQNAAMQAVKDLPRQGIIRVDDA